jgi:hypothetical protein
MSKNNYPYSLSPKAIYWLWVLLPLRKDRREKWFLQYQLVCIFCSINKILMDADDAGYATACIAYQDHVPGRAHPSRN